MRRLAVLALLALVSATPPRPAIGAELTTASFAVSWSGFDVGHVDVELVGDEGTYRLVWRSRTIGWFATLFPFESAGSASGRVEGARLRPETYDGRSAWRDGGSRWRVAFGGDGRATEVEVPPEDLAEREPVPHELRVGPDPASLALSVVNQAQPGLRLTARSFDGRRALDYDLACAESPEEPGRELACTISARLLAGGSQRWRDRPRSEADREPIRVWLRRDGAGRFWPVRLAASSRFGTVTGRLLQMNAPSSSG